MDLHGEFNRQASMGQIIAEGRTRNYINRLDLESLDDSLSLLDEVGYFYYPGHYPQSFSPRPIDHIHTILSNRRVIKLYQDLLLLNENDRSEVLLDAFENYLAQYQAIATRFAINSPQLHEHGYLEWSRISDGVDLPRTAVGTRHALQSLAILMSILGGDEVLAPLQKAFESPLIGAPMQEEAYDAKMLQMMRHSPLFPKEIQVQVAYHLLGSEAKANMPQANVETLRVPNYKSQVTRYDILHRAGQPVDYQHGFYDLEFVTVVDQPLIDRFMPAPPRQSRPLSGLSQSGQPPQSAPPSAP
ncbi:MAG: hypothetical protein HC898_02905 [Phycisphaerales bacterium]|nr:hypothetical protein [Phycisphaerales bacterium]